VSDFEPGLRIKLGLIGDNIAASQSPRLHELAGRILGREVSYELLIPRLLGLDFDAVFDKAQSQGFRGLNITYPYKERAIARVGIPEDRVRRLGAVNTVVFDADVAKGYNTDYSGFKAAYRTAFGDMPPGAVCMIGAGGVGKAVAFGLLDLGMRDLRVVERDLPKAEELAAALRKAQPDLRVGVTKDPAEGASGAQGLINCTPVGMIGYGGTPLGRDLMRGAVWAFDAVYTPVDTQFLGDATAEGLRILSGYELYFYQGFHAIEIFHGVSLDESVLRYALKEPA
jgi:shikimate dehydrogenase